MDLVTLLLATFQTVVAAPQAALSAALVARIRAILARPALRCVLDLATVGGSCIVVCEALLVAWTVLHDAGVRGSAVVERTLLGRGEEVAGGRADPSPDRDRTPAAEAARCVGP